MRYGPRRCGPTRRPSCGSRSPRSSETAGTHKQIGRQRDQAADVTGENRQRGRIVLQTKHTTAAAEIGPPEMRQAKSTACPAHGADTTVVATNGSSTRNAKTRGERHQAHWVDRDQLRRWALLSAT
ncbi:MULTISPECIES: restriction endonuclease [Streptomyces]|uniref:restriction endonuclease n=1 Tax=Streptomyces TaxID=1883 RepID=UPI000D4E2371|nr:hypothetical protein BV882_39565 [Streptomyces sp. 46]